MTRIRKLTAEELRRARPAAEVLTDVIGPKATKKLLCRGKGWQTRMNQVLREHMPKREK